jgi:hypothetical protein
MKNVLILGFVAMSLFACKKEGCTDSIATNYDSKAKKSNNSCTYEKSIRFWYDSNSQSNMDLDAIQFLKVYVNGAFVGNLSVNMPFSPNCEDQEGSDLVIYSITENNSSDKIVNYEVKDDLDQSLFTGTCNLSAVNCSNLELVY